MAPRRLRLPGEAIRSVVHVEDLDGFARAWLHARLTRGLLVLADGSLPLAKQSTFRVCHDEGGRIVGVGVRFEGFARPILSLVSDDAPTATLLLNALQSSARAEVLVVGEAQPLPEVGLGIGSVDDWLVAPSAPAGRVDGGSAELVFDPEVVAPFYAAHAHQFWSPALMEYGPVSVVRDPECGIVSAVGVNFVLPDQGYAQLSALLTTPGFRARGFASAALARLRQWLASRSIPQCGLFVEGAAGNLTAFYSRRGFEQAGSFRFFQLSPP